MVRMDEMVGPGRFETAETRGEERGDVVYVERKKQSELIPMKENSGERNGKTLVFTVRRTRCSGVVDLVGGALGCRRNASCCELFGLRACVLVGPFATCVVFALLGEANEHAQGARDEGILPLQSSPFVPFGRIQVRFSTSRMLHTHTRTLLNAFTSPHRIFHMHPITSLVQHPNTRT